VPAAGIRAAGASLSADADISVSRDVAFPPVGTGKPIVLNHFAQFPDWRERCSLCLRKQQATMMKIQTMERGGQSRLLVEGPLSGEIVPELETCWRTAGAQRPGGASARKSWLMPARSALLPIILLAAALQPSQVRAAEAPVTGSNDDAAMAFARYIAGSSQNAPWDTEIIEIEASLPRLEKQGHLRAVRHLQPLGKPQYQGVEIAGDETVKQQVIIRYLTAEAKAAEIPAASVAITPVNYKFSFKGASQTARTTTYNFSIKPRKKRPGLLKGELWLDKTGVVVRQSGYLVKSPSIFVKRINVTRETAVHDGLAEDRVTHVSVDTRLVGRAELTVHEHPCIDSACGTPRLVGE
jgi:hypothetical protein